AASIGAEFLAFFPTSYVAVAELGTIAGLGMVVAFVLSIVLLPALPMLMRPVDAGMEEVGFAALAPVDMFVHRRRRLVLGVAVIAPVLSAGAVPPPHLGFGSLNLKSAQAPSVATLQAPASHSDLAPHSYRLPLPSPPAPPPP